MIQALQTSSQVEANGTLQWSPHRPSTGLTGHLTIMSGGVGALAVPDLRDRYEADARPYLNQIVHIESSNEEPPRGADFNLHYPLTPELINLLSATAPIFGTKAEAIVRNLKSYLTLFEAGHGAKSVRGIMQAIYTLRQGDLIGDLQPAIQRLRSQGARYIQPWFASSSGGGTGSATAVILPLALADPSFRSKLLSGLQSDTLLPAVCTVVEPFTYAHSVTPKHATIILSNAFAFELETDQIMSRANLPIARVYHLGFTSPAGGVVLGDSHQMGRVLGAGLYMLQRNWHDVMAFDCNMPPNGTYRGPDIPEVYLRERRSHAPDANGQGTARPDTTNEPGVDS